MSTMEEGKEENREGKLCILLLFKEAGLCYNPLRNRLIQRIVWFKESLDARTVWFKESPDARNQQILILIMIMMMEIAYPISDFENRISRLG